MNRGFSLVELIVALLLFQVGILAMAGMVLLAQRQMSRAELTLRGVLEAEWVGDSLLRGESGGSGGSGRKTYPWGEVHWTPGALGLGGLRMIASRNHGQDTLAVVFVWPPLADTLLPGFAWAHQAASR